MFFQGATEATNPHFLACLLCFSARLKFKDDEFKEKFFFLKFFTMLRAR